MFYKFAERCRLPGALGLAPIWVVFSEAGDEEKVGLPSDIEQDCARFFYCTVLRSRIAVMREERRTR